jgi:hypothetical protein
VAGPNIQNILGIITAQPTPWSRALFEKLSGSQLVKKFPAFMEPDGSLPYSQEPATCPCPEPGQSSPCPHIPLTEDPS